MSNFDVATRNFMDSSRQTEGVANQIQININVMRTAYAKIAKIEQTTDAALVANGLNDVIRNMREQAETARSSILDSAVEVLRRAHEQLTSLRGFIDQLEDNSNLIYEMSTLDTFLANYNQSFRTLQTAFSDGISLLQSLQINLTTNTFFVPNRVKYIKKINVMQQEEVKNADDPRMQTVNEQVRRVNTILSNFSVFDILVGGSPITSEKLNEMRNKQDEIALAVRNIERQLIYGTNLLRNTGQTLRNILQGIREEEDDTGTIQVLGNCILTTDSVITYFGDILRAKFQAIVNFASHLPLTEIINGLNLLFEAGQQVHTFYRLYKRVVPQLTGKIKELIIHEHEMQQGGSSAQSSLPVPEETDFSIEKLYGLVLRTKLSTNAVFSKFCETHEYKRFLEIPMETPAAIHFKDTTLFDYQILLPLSLATTNALREGFEDSRSLCIVAEAGMGKSYMMYYTLGCLFATMEQDWTFVFCDNNVVKLYEDCIRYFINTQQVSEEDARNTIRCFDSPAALIDMNRISRPQISNLNLQSDLDRLSILAQEKVRLQRAFLMDLSTPTNYNILSNYLNPDPNKQPYNPTGSANCVTFIELLRRTDAYSALTAFYNQSTLIFDWNDARPKKWFVWIILEAVRAANGNPQILGNIGQFLSSKISTQELVNFSQWCDKYLIVIPEYEAVMTECREVTIRIHDFPGLDEYIPGASQVFLTARNEMDLAQQLNFQACMPLNDLNPELHRMNSSIDGMKVVFCSYDSNALSVYHSFINDLIQSGRRFNLILDEVDRIYSGSASTNQLEKQKMDGFKELMNFPAVKNMLGLTATTDFHLQPQFSLITALPNQMENLKISDVYSMYSKYYGIPITLQPPLNCENFSTDAGFMESMVTGSYKEYTILEMCVKHLLANILKFGAEASILAFVHALTDIDVVIGNILPRFLTLTGQAIQIPDTNQTITIQHVVDELPSDGPDTQIAETVCYTVRMIVTSEGTNSHCDFRLAVLRGANDASKLQKVMPLLQNIETDSEGNESRKNPFIPCICIVSAEKFDRGHDFFNFRSLIKFGHVSGPPSNFNWVQVKQINGRIRRVRSQKFFEIQGVGFFWYHPEEEDAFNYQQILNYIKEFEEAKTSVSRSNPIVLFMLILMLGAQRSRVAQFIANAAASSTSIQAADAMSVSRAEQSLFSDLSVKLLQFYAF